MSTPEREGLIEELGWLKVIVVLAATLEFSLVGWLVNTSTPPLRWSLAATGLALGVGAYLVRALWRADVILIVLKRSLDHDTP